MHSRHSLTVLLRVEGTKKQKSQPPFHETDVVVAENYLIAEPGVKNDFPGQSYPHLLENCKIDSLAGFIGSHLSPDGGCVRFNSPPSGDGGYKGGNFS